MNRIPRTTMATFFFTACWSLVGMAQDVPELKSPDQEIPELKVLDRLVGEWTFEFGEPGARSTGEFRAEWILEGRFIQKMGFIKNPDGTIIKTTSLTTFDPEAKKFLPWSFMSNGMTSEGSATWDAEKRELTEVRENEQFTVTTTTDWSRGDEESWRMVFTNKKNNQVMQELSGKNKKRPKRDE